MNVEHEHCQWQGQGEGCSQSAAPGRAYCEQHLWRVYQQGTAVRRKKDQRRAEQVWSIEDAFNEAVQELEQEGFDFSLDRW